jgi:hypothetical protein
MGFLNKLFGIPDDNIGRTFDFDALTNSQELAIDDSYKTIFQKMGEKSFPDDVGINYNVTKIVKLDNYLYAEFIPDRDTGYPKYVFMVKDNKQVACYCWEDEAYSLLFTSS